MSIAIASKDIASDTSATGSLTITKPTGLAAGDMMFAFVGAASATPFASSGWTAITNITGTLVDSSTDLPGCLVLLAKVATSGDAAASNFTFTGPSVNSIGFIYRITRTEVSSTWPSTSIANLVVSDADNLTSGSTFTGGVTPVNTNSLLLMTIYGGSYDSAASSAYTVANSNPSWTEQYDQVGPFVTNNHMGLIAASATFSLASATGDYSFTTSGLDNKMGILVSLSETLGVTVLPAVITSALSVQAPTVTGGANVSPAVVTMTSSVQAPTVSAGTAKWVNTDKSAAGSITNTDKS